MINLTITDKELKTTDAIKDYVEKKLERIEKYFANEVITVNVKTKEAMNSTKIIVLNEEENKR